MFKIIFIILLSIPIFQYRVYWLIVDVIGIGYAYFIDQFLPLIITSIAAFLIVKKYISTTTVKKYISTNAIPLLIIIISSVVVHGLVLGNYFLGEEPNFFLRTINNDYISDPVSGFWRGRHAGIYILLFELFYTKVVFYNIVILGLYTLTTIVLYIFLNQLFKKSLPAFIGTLFFVTTPAYLDMFFWQESASGMPIALSAGILSLVFLLAYQKDTKFSFLLLSIMFYLSMLKIGFMRLHGFIALPLYMCLFPIMSIRFRWQDIKKSVLLVLPFLSIFFSFLLFVFILPDRTFEHGISVRNQTPNTDGYMVALSMMIAYLFIPSQVAETYYPKIKAFLAERFFIHYDISFTLVFGLFFIGVLVVLGFFALKHIRQIEGQLIIFALIAIFANLILAPLFLQGYNHVTGLDSRFSLTGAGNGPGIRYVFVSAVGMSILVGVLAYWIVTKHKKYLRIFLSFVFSLLIYYSYLNIGSYINALKSINPGQSAVSNGLFSMVPNDGKKKLVYSTNPEKNAIDDKFGDFIHAFYKLNELDYTNSFEEVQKMIASGTYERNNFYAFYNNTHTYSFKDISELARRELYDNKIDQNTIKLDRAVKLTTFFKDTNNPSFPFVLERGSYISADINKRLLLSQKVSLSIQKTMLPAKLPYVDALAVQDDKIWQGFPMPLSIWDMLMNKPLIVDINQLNLPLSVRSLNNRTIDQLPLQSRVDIARELKNREKLKGMEEMVLSDVEQINKHYVDSQQILNIFLDSPSFNSLALVYACAEDIDWERQKKSEEAIGGIWYTKELPLNRYQLNEELSVSLSCFGSVLRKIILVGPPIPSEITVNISL